MTQLQRSNAALLIGLSNTMNRNQVMGAVRNVCFTFNVESFGDNEQQLVESLSESEFTKGYVFKAEIGEETGNKHFQGYIEFNTPLRVSRMKRLVFKDNTVHLERRRGTKQQAITYVIKDETSVEGHEPHWFPDRVSFEGQSQGARTDLLAVKESIMDGKDITEVCMEHFAEYCKYHGGITSAFSLLNRAPQRTKKTRTTLLLGPSGCGKSYKSWELAGRQAYVKPSGHQWFTGYSGQKNIILDDFSSGFKMSMTLLLNLMDQYPLQVRIHGGLINYTAENLYITSNTGPAHWYDQGSRDGRELQTLLRRIDCVYLHSEPRIGAQTTLTDPRYAFDIINEPLSDHRWRSISYQ